MQFFCIRHVALKMANLRRQKAVTFTAFGKLSVSNVLLDIEICHSHCFTKMIFL